MKASLHTDACRRAERTARTLRTDPTSVSLTDVVEALKVLPYYYFENRKHLSMRGVGGAADWLGYESALWQLGESVRSLLKAKPNFRGENALLDVVAQIALDARLGKGRQNFTLLLGEYGGSAYGKILGRLLDDPEVSGHAVKALARSRTLGYAKRVEAVLSKTKVGWIRSAARKYLSLMRE